MNRAWAVEKRALAIGLAVLLVLLVAAPVEAYWRAGFWVGLGTGALLTAPLWWPYAYGHPAYPPYPYYYPQYPYYQYPYYQPYPVYGYPATPGGSVPPPAAPMTPTTPTPSPLTPSPPAAPTPAPSAGTGSGIPSKCETVWVEGHYETHIGPSGQAATVWVPGGSRQLCQ